MPRDWPQRLRSDSVHGMNKPIYQSFAQAFATCLLAALIAAVPVKSSGAQQTAPVRESGAMLAKGWHPYLALAPALPLGRLGELTSLGVSGHVGAWYITPDRWTPGVGVEALYASFSPDPNEPLPDRLQIAGALVKLTSKGRQRVFYDWLGAYTTGGVGVFRAGTSGDGNTQTVLGVSASVGVLGPLFGREGFFEARFHHLFSGETLGSGNGLTFAPLVFGVRF